MAERIPACSKACIADAVTPFGDVTFARNWAGVSADCCNNFAEPTSNWRTNASEISGDKPAPTADEIRASATKNIYAGPEPEIAVTASNNFSSTRTTVPTLPNTDSAHSMSARTHCEDPLIAAAPSPTSAGVFGIARTTAAVAPAADCNVVNPMPAAIDSTRVAPACASAAHVSAAAGGLTAIKQAVQAPIFSEVVIHG